MRPDVSIIITVYTRLNFLREALQSAMNQTFAGYEIIVADDSGTAAARDICEPFCASGKFRYRANPEILGIVSSLRAAIQDAQGEFISILNDDDAWEPEFLGSLVPPLKADCSRLMAFGDHWVTSQDGSINREETEANTLRHGRSMLPEGDLVDPANLVLVKNGVPLAMAAVFRKNALDLSLLAEEVSGSYDFWISCILAASRGKFYYVPRRLARYRVHAGSETSRRNPQRFEQQAYIFSQLLARNWFPTMHRFIQKNLAGVFVMLGLDRLYFGRPRDARRSFFQSFRTRPNWRAVIGIFISFLPPLLRNKITGAPVPTRM